MEYTESRHLQTTYRAFVVICLSITACTQVPPTTEIASTSKSATSETTPAAEPPAPQKIPCPVKLLHPRMVHNLEEDVYATVVNISDSDITAIAFGAAYTDKFGQTWTTYRTDLAGCGKSIFR